MKKNIKEIKKKKKKRIAYTDCRRFCKDNKKSYKKKQKRKTVQVQLESLSFPLKIGVEALNNTQQNVCNRHLMMTHGGVEIVV